MENVSLSPEQEQLYKLLIQANENQTKEIKTEIQHNLKLVNRKIEDNKKELEDLKKKYIHLERRQRKNNVLIFGLHSKIQTGDLLEETIKLINNLLATTIKKEDVNNIFKVGRSTNPPIALEFLSYLKKISLYNDKDKLKQLKDHGISISNDLCLEDREEQKILKKHLNIARTQNYEAKIKWHKLYINNTPYTAGELINLEKQNDCDSNSAESSIEDNLCQDEEISEEIKTAQGTSKQTPHNEGKQKTNKEQPLVEENPAKQGKRKATKMCRYSPKNTRSKKPDK